MAFNPTNPNLYLKALQHKSYNETENNERLEFLGDAVISAIVTKKLFIDYPQKQEGFLSKKRSYLIGREHLNKVGEQFFKKVEIKNKLQKIPKNIYGNTLEAIIGAIFIDKGADIAEEFIIEKIYNSKFSNKTQDNDFKSKLQRESQKRNGNINYRILSESGPDHNKSFQVSLMYNNKKVSEGAGSSIKEAEQKAAKEACKTLF